MHRPVPDHAYVFSIAGRCLRCQATEDEHPKMLPEPNPMTGCPADHRSISTQPLVGGHGLEWTRCPFCNTMIEPALRTGVVTGPEWGAGRGALTPRQKDRLVGRLGWADFTGGR